MDLNSAVDEPLSTKAPQPPLRPSHWFWRPWYAKLWWAGAILFWINVAIGLSSVPYSVFHENESLFFLLILLFHPFFMIPVLGFGFLRAWINYHFSRLDHGDASATVIESGNCGMGFCARTSDLTDPLDSLWVANPINPASEEWRNLHVRGRL